VKFSEYFVDRKDVPRWVSDKSRPEVYNVVFAEDPIDAELANFHSSIFLILCGCEIYRWVPLVFSFYAQQWVDHDVVDIAEVLPIDIDDVLLKIEKLGFGEEVYFVMDMPDDRTTVVRVQAQLPLVTEIERSFEVFAVHRNLDSVVLLKGI